MTRLPTILVKVTQNVRIIQTLAFKQEQVTVGREPGMDITLPSSEVSRTHCRLEVTQGGVYVRDLESRNGTLLNGRPIVREKITTGDNLLVGDFKLWIQVVANPVDLTERASTFTDGPTVRKAASEAEDFSQN